MTVGELRKALEGLPDDMPVGAIDWLGDPVWLSEAVVLQGNHNHPAMLELIGLGTDHEPNWGDDL